MVVKTVIFKQINDVELVDTVFASVAYTKLEPLRIASCVVVWLQNQILFLLLHLDTSPQIPTFEPAFED